MALLESAIVLAQPVAGADPLEELAGVPLVLRAVLALQRAGAKRVAVVIPEGDDAITRAVSGDPRVTAELSLVPSPSAEAGVLLAREMIPGPWLLLPYQVVASRSLLEQRLSQEPADGVVEVEATDAGSGAVGTWAVETVTPAAKTLAVRLLFEACRKPVDGLVSRTLNRHISLAISRRLVGTSFSPNLLTGLTFCIGVAAALTVAGGGYWSMLAGAFLLQLNSILDGVDGELSRVRFQQSKLGAWLDTIGDDLSNVLFYVGLALGVSVTPGLWQPYSWLGIAGAGAALCTMTLYYVELARLGSGDFYELDWGYDRMRPGLVSAVATVLRYVLKQDFFIFVILLTAAAGVLPWMLPVIALMTALTAIAATVRTARWLARRGAARERPAASPGEPRSRGADDVASDPRDRFFDTRRLGKELAGRAVRGGRIVALAQVPRAFIDIGATLILVRLLLPEDFGLVGMVTAAIGFVGLFKDMGLTTLTVQRERITHRQVSALFWINVMVSAVLLVVVAAAAPLIARFYGEPRLAGITLALSATMLLGGLGHQHMALLRRQMRFGALKVIELLALVAGVAVAVPLAWLGAGYWALILRSIAGLALTTVGVWFATGWRPSRPLREKGLAEMVKFGADLTGFTFVNYFARNLDDVLIGRFAGATPAARATNLGYYQKAYELLMLPLRQLSAPVTAIAVATLSRIQSEPERYRRVYLRILRLLVLATMPLVAFLIVMAPEVVETVLGPNWLPAADLFRVLGVAGLTQPIGNSVGWLFISQNRTRQMLRWGLFGAGTAVVAFVAGLPWGAMGVAAAYSASSVLIRTPLLLWYIGREGPVRTMDFYRETFPFLMSALATVASLLIAQQLLPIAAAPMALLAYAPLAVLAATLTLAGFSGGRDTLRDAYAVALRRWLTPKKDSAGRSHR